MPDAQNIPVVLRSIAHLKPSMIYWRIHRTIKGRCISFIEGSGYARKLFEAPPAPAFQHPGGLNARYYCEHIDLKQRTFSFLNDSIALPAERSERLTMVARQPLLWQFHYGYHDYLTALIANDPENAQLLDDVRLFMLQWIEDYPLYDKGARKSAWHSYVISLRIEAWIRLSQFFPEESAIPQHIFQMTTVLSKNLELGTMANHFLKNIKALVLAGLYFPVAGKQFLSDGLRFLEQEINEQILDDGCHFERAPMYHVAMTSDVLDLIEALRSIQGNVPDYLMKAGKGMTAFLQRVIHPDGEVPFFNDSTKSFFLGTQDVLKRGQTVTALEENSDGASISSLNDDPARVSGLMVHRDDRIHLIFDAGNVGPDYQPGHAHCDTLSFEASIDGKRYFTDTGVYHYKESYERTYCRSTAAHNTVQIDGIEQSEVWKSFRVGRRAKVIAQSESQQGTRHILRGNHDGYTRLGIMHERILVIEQGQWIAIADRFTGTGTHKIESFLHCAPGVEVLLQKESIETSLGTSNIRIIPFGVYAPDSASCETHSTEYYPAFGVKESRNSLKWTFESALPAAGGYLLALGTGLPSIECARDAAEFRIFDTTGILFDSSTRHS